MPVLTEHIRTSLPVAEAFAFVADFANASEWDPGVASSSREDAGPVAVGARYRLGIRMGRNVAPMTYEVTRLEEDRRVTLAGTGAGVEAIDDITFAPGPDGTGADITYVADIRLVGWRRVLAPFAGATFRRIATNAREGMERALEQRAGTAQPPATPAAREA